jgi:hypothetical protein
VEELSWSSTHWAHPAIELRGDGDLWVTHPNGHTLERYDLARGLIATVETDLLELHCLRWPWAVDTGSKRFVDGADFETVRRRGRVVRLDDGFELPDPYTDGAKYSPTSIAVDAAGCIWIADGYGQSLVHRYTPAGELDLTIDGFATPHSLAIVDDLLLVCDRAHGVIKEYGLDGTLLRELGEGPDEDAWPNARDANGDIVRPPCNQACSTARTRSPPTAAGRSTSRNG